jgi:hypothetical protein
MDYHAEVTTAEASLNGYNVGVNLGLTFLMQFL